MTVYLQDSTIVLNSKDDVKRYLISTFEELKIIIMDFPKGIIGTTLKRKKYCNALYTIFFLDNETSR